MAQIVVAQLIRLSNGDRRVLHSTIHSAVASSKVDHIVRFESRSTNLACLSAVYSVYIYIHRERERERGFVGPYVVLF